MQKLLLLGCLALPFAVKAQFNEFKSGTYVLSSDGSQHGGELKLRNFQLLVVKNPQGKNLKLTPAEVTAFRLGNERYVTLKDADLPGPTKLFKDNSEGQTAFVQQVDSGQVMLLRYSYSQAMAPTMGAGGGMVGGGSAGISLYLLRHAGSAGLTVMEHTGLGGGNKNFRELLRPYLVARPDLLKLLDEKLLTESMLPELIHALNNGAAYVPPPRYSTATY